MRKFLIFCLLIVSFNAFSSISIISDFDDTIKITNSDDEVDGTINATFKTDVFTAIPEFFMGASDYSHELYILSASPPILRGRIEATLKKRQIAYTSLLLKKVFPQESKLSYKVKAIQEILEKSADDFILIGDDVGQDPEAYQEVQRLYPNRILAIYIHVIKNRPIPAGIKYWTTFDIFLREFIAGRMRPAWVEKSIELTLGEKKPQKIFPDFAHCPRSPTLWTWQLQTIFALEAAKLNAKNIGYCLSSSSDNLAIH